MFWPTWYATVLPEDWWSNAPAVSCKITSWVVKDDPLSEGLQGSGGFRAVCVCVFVVCVCCVRVLAVCVRARVCRSFVLMKCV